MKKLLFLLLLLPALSIAQPDTTTKKMIHEFRLGGGNTFYSFRPQTDITAGGRLALNYLYNGKNAQAGLVFESGSLYNGKYNHAGGGIIANRKFQRKRYYWYVGGMAGLFFGRHTWKHINYTGYTAGAQVGTVLNITRHISFTNELGLRWARLYGLDPVYGFHDDDDIAYLPLTIGLAYRF